MGKLKKFPMFNYACSLINYLDSVYLNNPFMSIDWRGMNKGRKVIYYLTSLYTPVDSIVSEVL